MKEKKRFNFEPLRVKYLKLSKRRLPTTMVVPGQGATFKIGQQMQKLHHPSKAVSVHMKSRA